MYQREALHFASKGLHLESSNNLAIGTVTWENTEMLTTTTDTDLVSPHAGPWQHGHPGQPRPEPPHVRQARGVTQLYRGCAGSGPKVQQGAHCQGRGSL